MEKTLDYIPLSGRTYVALQLQYSLRLCYDLDDDEVFRSRCLDMMRRLTTPYEELAARQAKGLMNSLDSLRWKYTPWDRVSKGYTNRIGGRDYFNPGQSEWSENTAFYPLRAVGEGIAAAALCPGYRVSDETLDLLCRLADAVDYDDHYSYAPMALINAYWLARNDKGVT